MSEEQPAPLIAPPPMIPPPPMPLATQQTVTRPGSVIAIGVFFCLAGLVEIAGLKTDPGRTGILPILGSIDSALFLVAKLAVAIGLFRMLPWARPAAIGLLIARFILGNLLTGLEFYPPLSSGLLNVNALIPPHLFIGTWLVMTFFTLIIYGVIIAVLMNSGVKAAFARHASATQGVA